MTDSLAAEGLRCVLGGRDVLDEVRLQVRPGEVLALIGPNGAGKTTLLRALARLLRPLGGAVSLEGQDIWRLRPRPVARRLALAPQGADLWPLTVEQFVGLGRAPHRGWLMPLGPDDHAAVRAAMGRTGLESMRERQVTELSGGEQRRAILARALAQEPRVLLLDEPTAALDLKYQAAILAMARRLAHEDGLAVVVTLHDLNQAAGVADRLALLAHGRVQAVGAPDEVLTAELISATYEVPVAVCRHPLDGTPLITPLRGE
ncbi:ABC transporter ATP-binding protein [Chloroflexales bacterium ZM16-3]|nr:ABC transporter ATP-binding protein [Chloroflexales bacterium ZM16-3]